MAVSKASKGQRRRRHREIKDKIAQAKKSKNKSDPPQHQKPEAIIVDISDSEDNEIICLDGIHEDGEITCNIQTPARDDIDNTFDLYDEEMEERREESELVKYMEATLDEETSDEEEAEVEDDPLQKMWKIFYGPLSSLETQPQRRVLKSGNSS